MSRVFVSFAIVFAIALLAGCKTSRQQTIVAATPPRDIGKGLDEESAVAANELSKPPLISLPFEPEPSLFATRSPEEIRDHLRADALYQQGYGYNNPNVDRIRQGKQPESLPWGTKYP